MNPPADRPRLKELPAPALLAIGTPRTLPDGRVRQWYTSEDMDLFVWFEDSELTAFELSYDKARAEQAVRWSLDGGLRHHGIDAGESGPERNDTPIAVSNGTVAVDRLLARFDQASGALPEDVQREIRVCLEGFRED